jgi:hypothetical protein
MYSYIFYNDTFSEEFKGVFDRTAPDYKAFDVNKLNDAIIKEALQLGDHYFFIIGAGKSLGSIDLALAFFAGFSFARKREIAFIGSVPYSQHYRTLTILPRALQLENYLSAQKIFIKNSRERERIKAQWPENTMAEELLVYSVTDNKTERARQLLEQGINPNSYNMQGDPILILAMRNKNSLLVRLIIEHGADINLPGAGGNTPLIEAAATLQEEMILLLLEHKAAINSKNSQGQTALILLIKNGSRAIIETLLKHGADIEAVDILGLNAEKYAALFKRDDIKELLAGYRR